MPGYELIGDDELNEIKDIFSNGKVLFRHGFEILRKECFKVRDFENNFKDYMNSNYALGVTSGTSALRVALAALGIKDGDEVITQSFTFVATVEAIVESRAIPICTEIDSTLNMDPDDLVKKITKKTKAVIAVHMLGTPSRIKEIKDICEKYNLYLIEDTAWGCGGKVENKFLGTFGDIGTYSFDFAKTITCGEGGMILFKNKEHFKKAAAWHDHGHENNPNLPRWEDSRSASGFNYRMSELTGAIGIAQLRKLNLVINKQRENKELIWKELKNCRGVKLRESPIESYETADALVFFVENEATAKQFRKCFLNRGFSTKILPEAISWHFAGLWDHIKELKDHSEIELLNQFPKSKELLSKSVALPINYNMPDNYPKEVKNTYLEALSYFEN